MDNPITAIVEVKLAEGKTEADLLAASERFRREFVAHQPGVLRRELVRADNGHYLDIVRFRSHDHANQVMEAEKQSAVCAELFQMLEVVGGPENGVRMYTSLSVHP